jgi:hypothetical protein
MSKRPIILLLAALLLTLHAALPLNSVRTVHADDQTLRLLSLPDLGSLEYPLATYSARADMNGLQNDATSDVLYPGAFTIAPNDAFVYQQLELGNAVYTVRIASVLPSVPVKADALPTLLGTLPLSAYDKDALNGVEVQTLTIDGLPAVRVNNFAADDQKVEAHLIVMIGVMAIEIVVLPAKLTGSPMHNDFMVGNADANRAIYEAMIESLKIAR